MEQAGAAGPRLACATASTHLQLSALRLTPAHPLSPPHHPPQSYAADLEAVQRLYERHKAEPPVPRNAPPVAGRILWARHLLARIEAPMARFRQREAVLGAKDSKRVVKAYNRLAQVRAGGRWRVALMQLR